jgi:hypothetical protein
VGLVRKIVAVLLMAIWPAVTSHTLLENLGLIHVAHGETFLIANNAEEHHRHDHPGDSDSHHGHQHHSLDNAPERSDHNQQSDDHHLFADGDYAWTSAGKTLTKSELADESARTLFCTSALNRVEAEIDLTGPAPPGTAPPLLQTTWQFLLRAAVPARAPSITS